MSNELTLRDRFAMAALTGLLARGQDAGNQSSRPAEFADAAYGLADEMLAERSRAVDGNQSSARCPHCDGTGRVCARCGALCGDAHPTDPMGVCQACGGTGDQKSTPTPAPAGRST